MTPPPGAVRGAGHFAALKTGARTTASRSLSSGGLGSDVRRRPTGERATIVLVDALGISEYEIDGATVFLFARADSDGRSSAAAYERGRAKVSKGDDTSLFRVKAPDDERQMLFVLCGTLANAKRARERIAWGGAEYHPTPDEIGAIVSRFHGVAEAGALNSAASWGGVGGLGLGSEGSSGPIRRPQG